MPACYLPISFKIKARTDTSSTVGPITYAESKGDRNLGSVQQGSKTVHYHSESACTYDGVIGVNAFTIVENAACYDGGTLALDGQHLTTNMAMCYIRVISGIGLSTSLDVRVGATTIMQSLNIGDAVTIPLNVVDIDKSIYVKDPNYEEGINELTVHMAMVGVTLGADTNPPLPDPAQFFVAPHALSDLEIEMIAAVGTDSTTPVSYKFTETTNNPGGSSSSWQNSNQYNDTGLTASTQYTYNVQMRDSVGTPNVGVVSGNFSATTNSGPDLTPPTPDPSTWSIVPAEISAFEIQMTATTATDPLSSPVQYYFEETSGNNGGSDSGWQASPYYTNTGLDPLTQYTYKVQTRDSQANVGAFSTSESATTLFADVTAPTPNPATFQGIGPNQSTNYEDTAVYMYATQAADNVDNYWDLQYRFTETSGNPGGASSGWQSPNDKSYTNSGLSPNTTYTYTCASRDTAGNVTAESAPISVTTWGPDTQAPDPNPATWAVDPTPVSPHGESGVTMTATTAVDPDGDLGQLGGQMDAPHTPVEYNFQETTGNSGATSSGWQLSDTHTDIGLTPGTQYIYTVQTRDSLQNTGTVSAAKTVYTDAADATPPNPNPSTWLQVPTTQSQSEISMSATISTDAETPPVEYYFTNVSGAGGSPSGWQASNLYTDTGLNPSTTYTYRIQTRNSALTKIYTSTSTTLGDTTSGPDINPPTPDPPVLGTVYHNGDNRLFMNVGACTDAEGSTPVEYRFNHINQPDPDGNDHSSAWQTSTSYNTGNNNLCWRHSYQWQVEARDSLGNTTALSNMNSRTTPDNDQTAPLPSTMTWYTVPYMVSDTEIAMVLTEVVDGVATDGNGVDQGPQTPVKYSIRNVTDGNWVVFRANANEAIGSGKGLTHTATGLTPATTYEFYCQGTDDADGGNNYSYNSNNPSANASATTDVSPAWNASCIHFSLGANVHRNAKISTYDVSNPISIPLAGCYDDQPVGANVLYPGSTGGVHGCTYSYWFKAYAWKDNAEVNKISTWPIQYGNGHKTSFDDSGNGKRLYFAWVSETTGISPGMATTSFYTTAYLGTATWYLVTVDTKRSGVYTDAFQPKVFINGSDRTGTYSTYGSVYDESHGVMSGGCLAGATTDTWMEFNGGNLGNNADINRMKVDEVTFWNDSLTNAQHLELYNSGVPMDPTTHSHASALTSYWKLNEGIGGSGTMCLNEISTGTPAHDFVLGNIAGTSNAPVWSNLTAGGP